MIKGVNKSVNVASDPQLRGDVKNIVAQKIKEQLNPYEISIDLTWLSFAIVKCEKILIIMRIEIKKLMIKIKYQFI